MRSFLVALLALVHFSGLLATAPPQATAAATDGAWATGFSFANHGIVGDVFAITEYQGDVIMAGHFGSAGNLSVNNIARWDGQAWHTLGNGIAGTIYTLAVYHGELIAGGMIDVGEVVAESVVRWDGTSWQPMTPVTPRGGVVYDLAVFRDKLIVGGAFESIGNLPTVHNLAQWDGSTWSTVVGTGADYDVNALEVLDDQLIIAGRFTKIGFTNVNRIARCAGAVIQPLGTGINDAGSLASVDRVAVHEGSLVAMGSFASAGGTPVQNIARWDGATWSPMGDGVNARVRCAGAFGGDLYVGGDFTLSGSAAVDHIARWDGSDWVGVGGGADNSVWAFLEFDGKLWAGGQFGKAGGVRVNHVGHWDTVRWDRVDGPVEQGVNDDVYAFTAFRGELIAAGSFTAAGAEPAWRVARWDGQEWRSIGTASGGNSSVWALAVYDDQLIAGGTFTTLGGKSISRIARWDGSSWSSLGTGGANESVRSLCVCNGKLVAGGAFTSIGGVSANHIAAWDGSNWAPLGAGLAAASGTASVYGMTGFDGGLVVVGSFLTAGGDTANNVARWSGSEWHRMGKGFPTAVDCAVVHQGTLYIGGAFRYSLDGIVAHRVARWDGTTWWHVGEGPDDRVAVLGVYGDRLIAGGWFTEAGGAPASHLAAWDGASWKPLGGGTNNRIMALASFDGGLYAGGLFTLAGGNLSSRVAKWTDSAHVPVELLAFTALRVGEGAIIRWEIAEAATGARFQLHREDVDGTRVRLTEEFFSGRASYEVIDPEAPAEGARYWLVEWSRFGEITWHGPAALAERAASPAAPAVRAAGPNPVRGSVRVAYTVPREGPVEIAVYDVTGRRVAVLVSYPQPAGQFETTWNGATDNGKRASAGSYFLRLTTAGGNASSRLVLLP